MHVHAHTHTHPLIDGRNCFKKEIMKLSKEDGCYLAINPLVAGTVPTLSAAIPVPSILSLRRWWVGRIWTVIPVVPSST